MKLSRRDFLLFATSASLAVLTPMSAFADVETSEEILSTETLEDGTIVFETTLGTWTISVEESGSLRTSSLIDPSGEKNYLVYNRSSGNLYSSITGETVNVGVDKSYRPRAATRGVIDHVPPTLRNGKTTYRTVDVPYSTILAAVGIGASAIAIAWDVASHVPVSPSDLIGVATGTLDLYVSGSSSHGVRVTYKETIREQQLIATGNWVYYDTVTTFAAASLY